MIGLRVYSRQQGEHIWARVYVSMDGQNYALAGLLRMRLLEYDMFRSALAEGSIQLPATAFRFEEIAEAGKTACFT
jgi:hypothetical protein